jgi:imidazolonepropionase-like amidohydrolase
MPALSPYPRCSCQPLSPVAAKCRGEFARQVRTFLDTEPVSWSIHAIQLPDGDRPVDLWVDDDGRLASEPPSGAERLPGRFVAPGLVDAHAHPTVTMTDSGPAALPTADVLDLLAGWAAVGVCLVRDTGSPGGSVLRLDLAAGMPRLQAAGRFLAPAGRYFTALLPDEVPQDQLTDLALAELARGSRWVKLIADFPPVADGMPAGPAGPTYSLEAVEAMITAVHAAGAKVAAHTTTDLVGSLVRAGVDSVEHGTGLDESALRLMAGTGAAWTPTLCAALRIPDTAPEAVRQRVETYRERLRDLLPLAHRLGVPILTGTDTAGSVVREISLLAQHGLEPAAALRAATTAGYRFLNERYDEAGQLTTLVTYDTDPREDLAALSAPAAVVIDGVRVR